MFQQVTDDVRWKRGRSTRCCEKEFIEFIFWRILQLVQCVNNKSISGESIWNFYICNLNYICFVYICINICVHICNYICILQLMWSVNNKSLAGKSIWNFYILNFICIYLCLYFSSTILLLKVSCEEIYLKLLYFEFYLYSVVFIFVSIFVFIFMSISVFIFLSIFVFICVTTFVFYNLCKVSTISLLHLKLGERAFFEKNSELCICISWLLNFILHLYLYFLVA